MPIYEYVCGACGVQRDVMQKVSDPALTQCPQCGQEAFQKKISAAGFQLKGGGPAKEGAAGDGGSPSAGTASTDSATAAPAA
jgi:putative FmdB family regulatory protein